MKYPVKYFGGSALLCYTRKYIEECNAFFDKYQDGLAPIIGETGIDGVLLDFNCGLRLQIPEGNWHVRIVDSRNELIFLDDDFSGVTLISMEKFYIEWEIALWLDGALVFYHQFDPTEQRVLFRFPRPALGDTISLLPYLDQFRKIFDCDAFVELPPAFDGIIKNYYPHLKMTSDRPDDLYATFFISGWMNVPTASPFDMRSIPMESFGVVLFNTPKISRLSKKIFTPTVPRSIEQKYVCIGVQASANPKCWLNPGGWDRVVDYLKSLGYRVLCIDRDRKCSNLDLTVEMPTGAEDFSGDYTLIDRVNQLAYADFFIGLGTGLSWLAWSVDIPVVLISGISEPWCEFASAYRVHNPLVCHGCFNDTRIEAQHIAHCVHHKGTPQAYECSKNITAQQVISAIDRLIADHKLEARHEK